MRTSKNTAKSGFDYQVQAWYLDGVYIKCGHPEAMACNCYGRLHAGEPVKNIGGNDVE